MSHQWFKPVNHTNGNETFCVVYIKDFIFVLQQQVKNADTTHPFIRYYPYPVRTPPLNYELAREVLNKAKLFIKNTGGNFVIWKEGKVFIGLVQMYSNKSVTTMKKSRQSFYALHICLLNVSDKTKPKLNINCETSVSSLSCKLDMETHVDNDDDYFPL